MKYLIGWRKRTLAYIQQVLHTTREMVRNDHAIEAFDEIVEKLENQPMNVGESRDVPERVLIILPFAVFYEVFDSSSTVMVYRVHYRGYPKIDV